MKFIFADDDKRRIGELVASTTLKGLGRHGGTTATAAAEVTGESRLIDSPFFFIGEDQRMGRKPGPLTDPAQLLEFHGGQMWSWKQAVGEQFQRMLETNRELKNHLDRSADMPLEHRRQLLNDSQLFMLSAWLCRQAACDCEKALRELSKNKEADLAVAAISALDDRLPWLSTLRHRIEHIDDYLRGKGHQPLPDPGAKGWVAHGEGYLIYEWAGILFHPDEVKDTVESLTRDVEAAIAEAEVPRSPRR